jgi:Ni,Fe-hydrogenase III large subunit
VLDRAESMGSLSRERALALGVVGAPARGARIPRDLRKDRPYAFYPAVDFKLVLADTGDVLARAKVMVEEVREAVAIACQVLEGIPPGATRIAVTPAAGRVALGWAESAHGDSATWVRLGEGGRVERWRVRSAAYLNWPALAVAMTTPIPDGTGRAPGNLVSDFPLVAGSFGLCVGCVDR